MNGVLLAWNSDTCVLQHVMVRLVPSNFFPLDACYVSNSVIVLHLN
jgi:hypothetical protein